ncbi:MAG: flagellar hook-length control protein FliK [Deltaproteobacteria bacterium]|jgi:hypothetical protein|nr:flagellar hook-length control protein FliK [Deltaproteobacteria bacterium]
MNSLAVSSTVIEYREIAITKDSLIEAFSAEDFDSYLERAKEIRDKLDPEERISSDAAQAEKSEETNYLKEVEKFKARRKKIVKNKLEVFQAQTILPQPFKEEVSQALMGGGQLERGLRGFKLTGEERPTKALKGLLENLKGEGNLWSLDRDCLPALGRVMLASGAETEKVAESLARLSQGSLTLDKVMKEVSLMEGDLAMAQTLGLSELNGGQEMPEGLVDLFSQGAASGDQLIATEAGLGAMGQFFLSLGLSTEAVKAVTSDLSPGEAFSSQSLRKLLSDLGEPLAPLLSDGDSSELFLALKSMGANSESLTLFSQYLAQTPAASLEDLLGFLAILDKPQETVALNAASVVQDLQSLAAGSAKEAELAKTPIFNEIILKLASLGDHELADDFAELSPALQALRGGISGLRTGGESLDGQGQRRGQEREKERLALSGIKSVAVGQGLDGSGVAQTFVAELSGYGSRESLARQLEKKLIYSARQGVHRLKMDLDPEELGRLDVELKVDKDKLTAHIRAETAEAYEALEREISSLKASLKESGLEMSLTLSFDGQAEKDRSFSRSDGVALVANLTDADQAESQEAAQTLLGQSERLLDKVI